MFTSCTLHECSRDTCYQKATIQLLTDCGKGELKLRQEFHLNLVYPPKTCHMSLSAIGYNFKTFFML